MFDRAAYLAALDELDQASARLVTDDCSLFELTGCLRSWSGATTQHQDNHPATCPGPGTEERNAHWSWLRRPPTAVEGRKLILGGVEVPYEKGLLGPLTPTCWPTRSADAVKAAALGDIGQQFPGYGGKSTPGPTASCWPAVWQRSTGHGWRIENIDATHPLPAPRPAPHPGHAGKAFGRGWDADAVSVKATTESTGFTGEGLGIAAHAVALIEAV
ncbi:MAG: 2-C-methyl-D-erythritol 2,4-cyclodiphosphate synthase [Faecalibacterium prausnitzii]